MHWLNVVPCGTTVLSRIAQLRFQSMVAQQGKMRAQTLGAVSPDPAVTYMSQTAHTTLAVFAEVACSSSGTLVECPPATPVAHPEFSSNQRCCTLLDGSHLRLRYCSGVNQLAICLICVFCAMPSMDAHGKLTSHSCCFMRLVTTSPVVS